MVFSHVSWPSAVHVYDHVHVNVHVYRRKNRSIASCGVECIRRSRVLSYQTLPRGFSYLADELKRAVMSIPQNIAEGVGKPTEADRSRYFGIARGSDVTNQLRGR